MTFTLPKLPYAKDALSPYISAETLEYHHDKHHQTYVDNLNKLIPGTEWENKTLEEIIKKSSGPIFNNAAQIWNHTFYFNGLKKDGSEPTGALAEAINKQFTSFTEFKNKFTQSALSLFGSGWTWLVKNAKGELEIVNTTNAANPMTDGKKPLFTCDVWEHAYYIDTRNARAKYLENFWHVVNWDAAAKLL